MPDDMLIGTDLSFFVHPEANKVSLFVTERDEALAGVELSTEQLDTIILSLGRARATMQPPIPRKLDPRPVFRDVTRKTVFHVDRQNVVSKEFFLAVLHPGFGWMAFPMEVEAGYLLSNLILRQCEAITPKIIKPKPGEIV